MNKWLILMTMITLPNVSTAATWQCFLRTPSGYIFNLFSTGCQKNEYKKLKKQCLKKAEKVGFNPEECSTANGAKFSGQHEWTSGSARDY